MPHPNLPKKIYQTAQSHQLESDCLTAHQGWVKLNPKWQMQLFDHDERRSFIEQYYDKDTVTAYDSLIPGAYQADLWRYCVLYALGGVYVDINKHAMSALDTILPPESAFVSTADRPKSSRQAIISNAFIAAVPKHPILECAIQLCVKRIHQRAYGSASTWPTGPILLGNAINRLLDREENELLTAGDYALGQSKFTLWHMGKKSDDSSLINQRIIYTDKSQTQACFHTGTYHRNEIQSISEINIEQMLRRDYSVCWRHRCMYKTNDESIAKNIKYWQRLFMLRAVLQYYKAKEKQRARRLLKEAFTHRLFNWHFFEAMLRYELLKRGR